MTAKHPALKSLENQIELIQELIDELKRDIEFCEANPDVVISINRETNIDFGEKELDKELESKKAAIRAHVDEITKMEEAIFILKLYLPKENTNSTLQLVFREIQTTDELFDVVFIPDFNEIVNHYDYDWTSPTVWVTFDLSKGTLNNICICDEGYCSGYDTINQNIKKEHILECFRVLNQIEEVKNKVNINSLLESVS